MQLCETCVMYLSNFFYFAAVKRWGVLLSIIIAVSAIAVHFRSAEKHLSMPSARPLPPVDTVSKKEKQLYTRLDTFFTSRSIHNGFSGSVLVSVGGKPVYEKCFGYCNYRNHDLMHDTASFQLASVSKNFTATAVLWCVEHKMLSLDDTLQKFFPKMPYKGVRVQDLLDHRSGLPNYLYFCTGLVDQTKYLNNQNVIDVMIKNHPVAAAKPNKRFGPAIPITFCWLRL